MSMITEGQTELYRYGTTTIIAKAVFIGNKSKKDVIIEYIKDKMKDK